MPVRRKNTERRGKKWDEHEQKIRRLYLAENKTLEEVRSILEVDGFRVSKHQLEYRCKTVWKLHKKISAKAWDRIASEIGVHRLHEATRQVFVEGVAVTPRRLVKEIERRRRPVSDTIAVRKKDNPHAEKSKIDIVPPVFYSVWNNAEAGPDPVISGLLLPTFAPTTVTSPPQCAIGRAELIALLRLFSNASNDMRSTLSLSNLVNLIGRLMDALQSPRTAIDVASNRTALAAALETITRYLVAAIFQIDWRANKKHPWSDEQDRRLAHTIAVMFQYSRQLGVADLDGSLLYVAIRAGHAQLANSLWDQMAAPAVKLNPRLDTYFHKRGQFDRLIQVRASGTETLVRKLASSLAAPQVRALIRSIIAHGDVDHLRSCFPLAGSILDQDFCENAGRSLDLLKYSPGPLSSRMLLWNDGSILVSCLLHSRSENAALERVVVFLQQYQRHHAHDRPYLIGPDALVAAASMGYCLVLDLLSESLDLRPMDPNPYGYNALHAAAQGGHLELCRQLIDRGMRDLDAGQRFGGLLSAFFLAFHRKHLAVCSHLEGCIQTITPKAIDWRKVLCSCDVAPKSKEWWYLGEKNEYYWTVGDAHIRTERCALCWGVWRACITRDIELLAFCLDHGAGPVLQRHLGLPNIPPVRLGFTRVTALQALFIPAGDYKELLRPLMCDFCNAGCEQCDDGPRDTGTVTQCAKLLLAGGASLTGGEVLDALRLGDWAAVQLLTRHDPDGLGTRNEIGTTLLEAAIYGRSVACFDWAMAKAANAYDSRALCAAVYASLSSPSFTYDWVHWVRAQRPVDKSGDVFETTAIGIASLRGDKIQVQNLLDAVKTPFQRCRFPADLLAAVVRDVSVPKRQTAVVTKNMRTEALFPFSCGPNIDSRSCSPVALAVYSNKPEIVSRLLSHGFVPDTASVSIATRHRAYEILQLLLRGQPTLRQWAPAKTMDLWPPLTYAAINCDFSTISQLLSAGADVEDEGVPVKENPYTLMDGDRWTMTPLQAASRAGHLSVVLFLLQRGANPNASARGRGSATALQHAVHKGHLEVARALLKGGADLDAPATSGGATCLERAAMGGRIRMLELLMERNVAVDGLHRMQYLVAIFMAERDGHKTAGRMLRSYGGWSATARVLPERLLPAEDVVVEDLREVLRAHLESPELDEDVEVVLPLRNLSEVEMLASPSVPPSPSPRELLETMHVELEMFDFSASTMDAIEKAAWGPSFLRAELAMEAMEMDTMEDEGDWKGL